MRLVAMVQRLLGRRGPVRVEADGQHAEALRRLRDQERRLRILDLQIDARRRPD